MEDAAALKAMLRVRGHPASASGWWCGHPLHMRALIPHLVSDASGDTARVRAGHLVQISSCRECARQYHAQLRAWSMLPENAIVADETVAHLAEDDVRRLTDILEETGKPGHSQDAAAARNLQLMQREALFEVCASFTLARNESILRAVHSLFGMHEPDLPVSARETPPTSYRRKLPGLLALAVRATGKVQRWARELIRPLAQEPEEAPHALASVVDAAFRDMTSATEMTEPSQNEMAQGVFCLLLTCPRHTPEALSASPVVFRNLLVRTLADPRPSVEVLRLSAAVLRRVSDAYLDGFWEAPQPSELGFQDIQECTATPAALLGSVQECFGRHRGDKEMLIRLLKLYEILVELLPQMRRDEMSDVMTLQQDFLLLVSNEKGETISERLEQTGRKVAGKSVVFAYESSAPYPPFQNGEKLLKLIRVLCQEPSLPDLAVTAVAVVLLTDACNTLRAIHGHALSQTIISHLSCTRLNILKQSVLDSSVFEVPPSLSRTDWDNGPIPLMDAVWADMSEGSFFDLLKSCTIEAEHGVGETILEVHKLVGFVSPAFGQLMTGRTRFVDSGQILFPLECVARMQETVLRFLRTFSRTTDNWWRGPLATHCSHLMCSRRAPIRAETLDFVISALNAVDRPNERMSVLCRAFVRAGSELAEKVVDGMMTTSRLLLMFEREPVFEEYYLMLLFFFNLVHSDFLQMLLWSEEDPLHVLRSICGTFFTTASRARAFGVRLADKKLGKGLMAVGGMHDMLAGRGGRSPLAGAVNWAASSDVAVEALRKGKVIDQWVQTIGRMSADEFVDQSTREYFERMIKKAVKDEYVTVSRNHCLLLAKRMKLSRSKRILMGGTAKKTKAVEDVQVVSDDEPAAVIIPRAKPKPVSKPVNKQSRVIETPMSESMRAASSKTKSPAIPRKAPSLSPAERFVISRGMSSYYPGLLRLDSAQEMIPTPCSHYRTAEDYVQLWTAVLLKEGRASIEQAVQKEDLYYEGISSSQQRFVRAPFDVMSVDAASSGGGVNFWRIVMEFRGYNKLKNFKSRDRLDPSYVIASLQVADVVRMERETGHQHASNDPIVTYAVVTQMKFGKHPCFTLELPIDANFTSDKAGQRWRVSRVTSVIPLTRQLNALWNANALSEPMLRGLLRPEEAWKIAGDRIALNLFKDINMKGAIIKGDLNPSQEKAVRSVVEKVGTAVVPVERRLSPTNPQMASGVLNPGSFSLIQGPPGTGKTSTILAMLSTLLADKNGLLSNRILEHDMPLIGKIIVPTFRVLVCAPSNAAVDELCKRVMQKGLLMADGVYATPHVVRIGARGTVEETGLVEVKNLAKLNPDWCSSVGQQEVESAKKVQKLAAVLAKAQKELDQAYSRRSALRKGVSQPGRSEKAHRRELANVEAGVDAKKKRRDDLRKEINVARGENAAQVNGRNGRNTRAIAIALNRASIVFSTLNGSAHDIMEHLAGSFDVVIVDEAGQCLEPDVLIPFSGRCVKTVPTVRSPPLASHCVLVGDPQQLPATVLSNDPSLKSVCGKSLFERLADSPSSEVHLLNVQYRMHPDICHFPSKQFYDLRLLCGHNVLNASYHRAYHFDAGKRFGPLTFLDTSLSTDIRESRAGNSVKNQGEALVVVKALLALFRLYPREKVVDDIVVLSPYSAQVATIKREVNRHALLRGAKIEVSTVDSIQGREKSIVFFSAVRGAPNGRIGFVKDRRRMNVALTRAQHAVVVIGNARALTAGGRDWADFVAHCTAEGRRVAVKSINDIFPEGGSSPVRPVDVMEVDITDMPTPKWEPGAVVEESDDASVMEVEPAERGRKRESSPSPTNSATKKVRRGGDGCRERTPTLSTSPLGGSFGSSEGKSVQKSA